MEELLRLRRRRRVRQAGRLVRDLVSEHNGDKEKVLKELENPALFYILVEIAIRLVPIIIDIYFSCENANEPQNYRSSVNGAISVLSNVSMGDEATLAATAEDAEDDDMLCHAKFYRFIAQNHEVFSDEYIEEFGDGSDS